MRSFFICLATTFTIVLFGQFSLQGCSTPPTVSNDAGTGNKDAGTNPPKTLRCSTSLGTNVNADCTDGKDCVSQRDCTTLNKTTNKGICLSKICATLPTEDATTGKDGKGTPDLSCLDKAPELPKGPEKATYWGPVETFGLDKDTDGIKVEIFEYNDNGKLDKPIGSTTSTNEDDKSCKDACTGGKICFQGSCHKKSTSDNNKVGYFAIKDVPTNKLLVFRTSGPELVTTIQYFLWVPADKVKDGRYKERAFVITNTTKSLIPPSAGISAIHPGNSAIAGEIQDCTGKQIENSTVTLSVLSNKLAYFNAETERPDRTLNATSNSGIYSALNIKVANEGVVRLVAAAKVGGKTKLVADFKARLFPDGITILTTNPWFPGKK